MTTRVLTVPTVPTNRPAWTTPDSLVIAVVIMVLVAVRYWLSAPPVLFNDPGTYIEGAESLATRGEYGYTLHDGKPPITLFPPLQSGWLSLWWRPDRVWTDNVLALSMGQGLVGALALAMILGWWHAAGMGLWARLGWGLCLATSPLWWVVQQFFLADLLMLFFAYGVLILWERNSGSSAVVWGLTGLGISLCYLARTASTALMVALLPALGVLVWQRRWRALLAVGTPLLAVIVFWHEAQLRGGGFSYGSAWKGLIADLGGWRGYFDLQRRTWTFLLFVGNNGFQGLLELPRFVLDGLSARPGMLGKIGLGLSAIVWFGWHGMAALGFWKKPTRLHQILGLIWCVNLAQTLVQPWSISAGSFRYLSATTPLLMLWVSRAWPGWTIGRNPILVMLVVFNCGLNLREISLRRRYLETEFREIEAVADWIRENTPPESRIAIHMVLPFWTLSKLIQREVSDDYLWPADSTSPLSQQAQARACPDYLVTLMDPGPRTRPIPSRVLEPVFRTQTGRYRVLRVGSELGPPAREGARQRPADTNSR